jgi:NAD(P)-dependent dehydrogenase (short-subunit alcohol dehydrogenase family)
MKLKDRVAIVTGGGSGIGEATALRFVDEGAKVAIADVVMEGANKVAEVAKEKGGEVLVHQANICKKEEVDGMVAATLDQFGKVDILINNAGINKDAMTKKMTEEQWDQVLDVNLKGTFLCSQSAARPMMEQNYGRIINTASIGALGNMGQANYTASKAGVMGLTKTLALELARYNITVNCISPGATKTPMLATMPEDIAERFIKKIPLRRFAEPEELANAHLFLASEEAGYITGQVIFVDGGISVGF